MISVILTVLKVIGWLLLILFLLLLTVILVILFVSVRYRVAFENEEYFKLQFKISWLFPLFLLKGSYQTGKTESGDQKENPQFQMYIFGFRLKQKDENAKKKAADAERSEPQLVAMEQSAADQEEKRTDPVEQVATETVADSENEETLHSDEKQQTGSTKKSHIFESLREKYTLIKAMINEESNKRALRLLLSEIRYLLKHYWPRSMEGSISYATGDPANTGLVTGALSLCPFVYGKKMEVIPDFESEAFYIRGNACLIGHIRLVHLLKSSIVLFFDKDIRRIAYQLKK